MSNRFLSICPPLFGFPVFLAWLLAFLPHSALAGLSASEVVVVVNGESLDSRTLANHYVQLREIPAINVVVLNEVPKAESISVKDFREKILRPLLQQIEQRQLANHVQCIAYSADFPTAIQLNEDLAQVPDLNFVFTKVGSINGLTYLYDPVLRADPAYISPEANFYARRNMDVYFTNPGGNETSELWADINILSIEKDWAKASESVEKLADEIPYQYPLRYLAAAYAAQAGDADQAIGKLDAAISAGWTSGGYLASDSRFDALRKNDEFQSLEFLLEPDSGKWQPTTSFNARSAWASNGVEFTPNPKQANLGMRYMLSIVLGVTRGRGTTLQEAIDSLKRAHQADFTHPQGSFYFASTKDVRTTTRRPNFDLAIAELKKLGFDAEVIVQPLPQDQSQVLGAQIGAANFDWQSSGSSLVPGAIVDNLTSLGGVMTSGAGQTPLTHLISAGAAGSSGTVTEPYSVQFKFPDPMLYVHYARGLSLVESFYQSVTGPYQLLIVGDPLCQPFSNAPNQPVDTTLRKIPVNGAFKISPDLTGPSYLDWLDETEPPAKRKLQLRPSKIGVQIDGGPLQGGNIQPTVNVQLDNQTPGYHEVQVLMISDDPLKQRFAQTIPVWIGPAIDLQISAAQSHSFATGPILVQVKTPADCVELSIFHLAEPLQSKERTSEVTEFQFESAQVGLGPVRWHVVAKMKNGTTVTSQPTWSELTP